MADKKTNVVFKGITPAGIATWAWLDKPDNSEYGKGKFKCALKLEKGDEKNDAFARKIIDLHKAAKGKKDTVPVKDGDAMAEDNEKRESMRGFWVLTAKTNKKPDQVDAKKKPLAQTARSGDLVKLNIAAAEFDTGANKGVTLYLHAVQLLERRALSAADAFDEEDEYAADTASAETSESDDSDDRGDSSGSDDEDF